MTCLALQTCDLMSAREATKRQELMHHQAGVWLTLHSEHGHRLRLLTNEEHANAQQMLQACTDRSCNFRLLRAVML